MRRWNRNPRHQPGGNIWHRWVLNIGAVLGSLCLLVAVLTLVFGLKPLIFASGSMGPAITTGSLGLALPMPVAEVIPGQVVSVVTSNGTRVTHRVVKNLPEGLILKGDANSTADLQPYQVATADRLLVSVPALGYVASWFSQPWAFFVGGLLCAYLLYVAFIRNDGSKGTDHPGSSAESAADVADNEQPGETIEAVARFRTLLWISSVATILAVVVSLGVAVRVQPTLAAFSATAEADTGTLTALTLPPVSGSLACRTTGGILGVGTSAELSWNAQAVPAGARFALRLQSAPQTFTYVDAPTGSTRVTLAGGLNLLGLITSGGNQTLPVSLLVVHTTDGDAVNSSGANIGWSTPVASSPGTSVTYHPGYLLVRYFSCP